MCANKKSDSILFSGPNKARYHELEQKVIKYYVREKRNEGFPTTREVIRMKVRVCTNRQNGQYGNQSECGLVHADDEKSTYVVVQNNTCTASSRRICRESYLI